MRKWEKVTAAFAVALLAATGAFAQTSGRIIGIVKDANGGVLPGVTLTASGTNLPGTVTAVSEGDGAFRMVNLPPGVYTVSATLDGFNTVEQHDIKLGIDRTITLDLTMTQAFASEVTVLGEAPVVDTTQATAGVSVSTDTFEKLPLARDFYAVAQIATGASKDAAGTSFYGSTGAENQYVIEGLNTTSGRLGTEAKTLNFDFIQEVEVKTGGLTAEYGRLTGGLINAITKSGGNQLEGNVFGFYENGADNTTADDIPATLASIAALDNRNDYGFSLGGAFIQDKLWFFGAYDRQSATNAQEVVNPLQPVPGFGNPPGVGSSFDSETTSDLYSGKLTWRVTPNHNLAFSVIGDPSTADGAIFPIAGPETTFNGKNETGSNDYLLRYDGVVGASWVLDGLVGRHRDKSIFSGAGTEIPLYIDRRGGTPYPTAGGFGYYENQENTRDVAKFDVSKFLGSKLELKVGADREDVSVDTNRFNGGAGQRIYIFSRNVDGVPTLVYRHRYYVDPNAPGFDRDRSETWVPLVPLSVQPETINTAAYAQATIKPLSNLTFNLGLRWEVQDIQDGNGNSVTKIDDNYAPRLQVAFDPQNNGRSKVFASWGRYYESVPLDMNVRAFGGELSCFCYNFSPDPNDTRPDPNSPIRTGPLLGGATPVDPDLKGQFVDEALLGYEREVAPNLVVGVQGTYRNLGRVIEDFLVDPANGQYAIANPGEGTLGRRIYFYDYVGSAPGRKAKREYTGVELDVRKRYSHGWQLFASYLWSKLEGNYDGVFQASTGQLDPNINSAFDYADFQINADGKLSNDRTHNIKINGSYTFEQGPVNGLNIGFSTYWRSGAPLTAYGYSFAYSNWEYYLTPRGALGRGPSDYEANLSLSYPIKLGGDKELQVMFDVFNLLDKQMPTSLDQRYNLDSQGACAGIPDGLCNGDGGLQYSGSGDNGSTTPVGQIPNPRASATNPDFLKAGATFTAPRSYRLGLRLRF